MQSENQQSTVNPAFAAHAAQQLQEATGGIQRVFDNIRQIARGDDPKANAYDRLRAIGILYDRGCGKVTRNTPRPSNNGSKPEDDSPEPKPTKAAESNRPVARLEQKIHDTLGPPQAPAQPNPSHPERSVAESKDTPPIRLDEPGHIPAAPGYTPDLVREAQFYVLEITNYSAELASILASIHDPDPEDTSIRTCHRLAAGRMILDRILGAVADLEQPLDHWHDPSLEPNWINKHPAEIDSSVPLDEIIEADRFARKRIEGLRKEREEFEEREETGPCDECEDGWPCDYHATAEELSRSEEEVLITARGMRNLNLFHDRLYFDENGLLRLHPPPPIDDS